MTYKHYEVLFSFLSTPMRCYQVLINWCNVLPNWVFTYLRFQRKDMCHFKDVSSRVVLCLEGIFLVCEKDEVARHNVFQEFRGSATTEVVLTHSWGNATQNWSGMVFVGKLRSTLWNTLPASLFTECRNCSI